MILEVVVIVAMAEENMYLVKLRKKKPKIGSTYLLNKYMM